MMDGLEIRTVNSQKRVGAEYANGLHSREAMRAMWWKLADNAREAIHRPFGEYMAGRTAAARAIRGSRRFRELKTASTLQRGE